MSTRRLEAFSDGVIAIIMTIMVLELRTPRTADLAALRPVAPLLVSYALSFVNLAIYWNNHHHLLHVTQRVTGRILWANLHLLFWLSLVPFVTGWMGVTDFAPLPTASYGFVLLLTAAAYYILQRSILINEGSESVLGRALGTDWKGKLSPVLYLIAIPLAFLSQWIAGALYITVAVMWLVPDQRIERVVAAPAALDGED